MLSTHTRDSQSEERTTAQQGMWFSFCILPIGIGRCLAAASSHATRHPVASTALLAFQSRKRLTIRFGSRLQSRTARTLIWSPTTS